MRRLLGFAPLALLLLGLGSTAAGAGAATTPSSVFPVPSGAGYPFTIALIPDTQTEVQGNDPQMVTRNQWLIDNREAMDLRFVAQVGDLTNWGWLDPRQLAKASSGFRLLEQAGIPYSIAVGNHDGRAIGWNGHGGYGGSAYVLNPECLQRFSAAECHTRVLVRRTQEINAVFDAGRFGRVAGAFEAGKIDNVYSTFNAGGKKWLVLDLELWPRASAVAWADRVVEEHPTYNVIVNTHSYTNWQNNIAAHAHYGDTAPLHLWHEFISQHPNISMVICGHTGHVGMRVDTGAAGNKVVTFMQDFSDEKSAPVRLVKIYPRSGAFRTWIYGPQTKKTFPNQTATVNGVNFVG